MAELSRAGPPWCVRFTLRVPGSSPLRIRAPRGERVYRISDAALRRGVLIGAYARCQASGDLLADSGVSRVHALLIEIGERPTLIDTASSAGLGRDGAPRSVFAIDEGAVQCGKPGWWSSGRVGWVRANPGYCVRRSRRRIWSRSTGPPAHSLTATAIIRLS